MGGHPLALEQKQILRLNQQRRVSMPQPIRSSLVITGVAAAVMLMGAELTDVRAQQQQQPVMPPELSEGQIETFADAALDVRQVQQDFNAEMQAAQDAEEMERLQQQAQEQAQQAIEDNGLSVDEYNAIVQAANQDPQLYAMIVEVMEQKAQ
jgi:thiol:disulfide interchange protein